MCHYALTTIIGPWVDSDLCVLVGATFTTFTGNLQSQILFGGEKLGNMRSQALWAGFLWLPKDTVVNHGANRKKQPKLRSEKLSPEGVFEASLNIFLKSHSLLNGARLRTRRYKCLFFLEISLTQGFDTWY